MKSSFEKYAANMVEWRTSRELIPYPDAVAAMEARVAEIAEGRADELVWLLEHPPLLTAGTSAVDRDLLRPGRFPVFRTGRGGEFTYHGPGQRVVYVLLDLSRRGRDVRRFVGQLEEWVIRTLADFQITGERREGRVGVWVSRPDKAPRPGGEPAEDKIAAIGVRLRKWVSYHGIAINLDPDLSHFDTIVPCGIAGGGSGLGVTSLVDLGLPVTLPDLDLALLRNFEKVFDNQMQHLDPEVDDELHAAHRSESVGGVREVRTVKVPEEPNCESKGS